MKLTIFIALLLIGTVAKSQSIFKPVPKPTRQAYAFKPMAAAADSTVAVAVPTAYTTFRFTGPTVMYALSTSGGGSTLGTFIGLDYEHCVYNTTSQKYYTTWAIGIQGGEGGQFAPDSVSAVTMGALTFSTQQIGSLQLPFKLTIGVVYNFSTKKFLPATGPGVTLNN